MKMPGIALAVLCAAAPAAVLSQGVINRPQLSAAIAKIQDRIK